MTSHSEREFIDKLRDLLHILTLNKEAPGRLKALDPEIESNSGFASFIRQLQAYQRVLEAYVAAKANSDPDKLALQNALEAYQALPSSRKRCIDFQRAVTSLHNCYNLPDGVTLETICAFAASTAAAG